VAALPEVFRMAGQIGIVPFDAERLKRPHILRKSPRAAEPGVEVVDVLDGKHKRTKPSIPITISSGLALVRIVHQPWGLRGESLGVTGSPEEKMRVQKEFHRPPPNICSISSLPIRSKSSGTKTWPAIKLSRRT
jgi:hypothetical protein